MIDAAKTMETILWLADLTLLHVACAAVPMLLLLGWAIHQNGQKKPLRGVALLALSPLLATLANGLWWWSLLMGAAAERQHGTPGIASGAIARATGEKWLWLGQFGYENSLGVWMPEFRFGIAVAALIIAFVSMRHMPKWLCLVAVVWSVLAMLNTARVV